MLWMILIIATVQPMAGFWNMLIFLCDTKFGCLHRSMYIYIRKWLQIHMFHRLFLKNKMQQKHISSSSTDPSGDSLESISNVEIRLPGFHHVVFMMAHWPMVLAHCSVRRSMGVEPSRMVLEDLRLVVVADGWQCVGNFQVLKVLKWLLGMPFFCTSRQKCSESQGILDEAYVKLFFTRLILD